MNLSDAKSFTEALKTGTLTIDTRPGNDFADRFLKGALLVPFGPDFLSQLQTVINDEPFQLMTEQDQTAVIQRLLAGTGHLKATAFYAANWDELEQVNAPYDMLITIDAEEFAIDYQFDEFFLIDVRSQEEFDAAHVEDAENIQLADLTQMLTEMDETASYYVYGSTADEAITAASLFKQNGYQRVRVVSAPFAQIAETKVPLLKKSKKQSEGK